MIEVQQKAVIEDFLLNQAHLKDIEQRLKNQIAYEIAEKITNLSIMEEEYNPNTGIHKFKIRIILCSCDEFLKLKDFIQDEVKKGNKKAFEIAQILKS